MTRRDAHQIYETAFLKAQTKVKTKERQVKALTRAFALNDLFFLLVNVLGRKDCDRDWIYERIREVEANPDGHIDLWAREHYKSTIITFGLTIQDILKDPEQTFGILSHTRPIAKGFLRQIKLEFESNARLKALFDDILYDNPRQAPKWSEDDGIVVKRKTNPKEATVEAWGLVDGQPTSKHFKTLLYEDVVTRESVTTTDQIDKVNKAWELSLNLGAEDGRRRYVGTRYHYNDTYRCIIDRGAAIPRVHPGTHDGTMTGRPVLWSPETMAEKRRDMGPYVFGCQILLDPKADTVQGFQRAWLKFWPAMNHSHLNKILLVDPAGEKKKDNDYTVMLMIGLGEDENYYVIDMIRDRLSLTERSVMVFKMHRDYRPGFVGYEKYGKDSDIEFIQYLQDKNNYRFGITPLGGNIPKKDRINKLVPIFEQGRIFLPDYCLKTNYEGTTTDLVKEFIEQEYMAFPVPVHDDMLDCMARIMDPDCSRDSPATRHGYNERVVDTWLGSFGATRRDEADYRHDIYAR